MTPPAQGEHGRGMRRNGTVFHRLPWLRDLRESIGLPSLRVRASLEEAPEVGVGARGQ